MSRSNYTDDCDDQWALIRWRGAVNSAIKGRKGQKLLSDTLKALDAMPEKRLIANVLVTEGGEYCTLGVLGAARGLDLTELDPDDSDRVAEAFGIADALAREIVYINDEGGPWGGETPEQRWSRVRSWVAGHIQCGDQSA